jgi:hypothetical protein
MLCVLEHEHLNLQEISEVECRKYTEKIHLLYSSPNIVIVI